MIVFGGYVASSESGMGCGPEWPLCNREVIPVLADETLIEFAHRFIGLVITVLVAALFTFIRRSNGNKEIQTAATWLLGLLIIQVFAGAVVVLLDLPTIVITVHLLVAMLFMFVLLRIYRIDTTEQIKGRLSHNEAVKVISQLNLLIVLILLTMGFGAYIKHEYYGLACNWLACKESLLPVSKPEILQTGHRVLAIITALYTIFLLIRAYLKNWSKGLKRRIFFSSIIVFIQIVSGILTIMTKISIPWAVVHLAIGTAFYMIIVDARLVLGLTITERSKEKWKYQNWPSI